MGEVGREIDVLRTALATAVAAAAVVVADDLSAHWRLPSAIVNKFDRRLASDEGIETREERLHEV